MSAQNFSKVNIKYYSFSDKKIPVHIIGAGGVGMSGLAILLQREGFQITASDKKNSTYLEKLYKSGIQTWTGSCPEKIPENAVVFYSTAISGNDLERKFAESSKMPIYNRNSILKYITEKYFTIAVAGSHGKTTTSGWIACMLENSGLDPTALIGGTVKRWNANIRLGEGKFNNKRILVIEADESDQSFLSIRPDISAITNIDMDHNDFYKDISELYASFRNFVENSFASGGTCYLSYQIDSSLKHEMYKNVKTGHFEETFQNIKIENKKLLYENNIFEIGLSGEHNLYNASCVLAVAKLMNIDIEPLRKSLVQYEGISRRMDVLFQNTFSNNHELKIIDDYAHHPREVRAVLKTLTEKEPNKEIIAVWEPHRISRFVYFYDEFIKSFEEYLPLKKVFLLPIFAASDNIKDYPQFQNQLEELKKKTAGYISGKDELKIIKNTLEKNQKDTVVVFMGAAESSEYAKELVKII
ncbi:MAG: Mur ligase family protein [Spirochaetia bacterium]|nr:Mur ligase family protein [Spirochaetia bacterium]